MKDQKVKDVIGGVKTYFVEMPKKRRSIVFWILSAIVVIAAAAAIALNINASKYKVLYSGLDQGETNKVYNLLEEQEVAVQINAMGELVVPASQYDALLLQLAGQGYPQSALSYDVFSSHSGLTATESERKQGLIYQLQDRVQATLQRINGVKGATVTINIPDTSDYVWQQTEEKEKAHASVLLSLEAGSSLDAVQVDAVRKLVAAGCPNMDPKNVTVVDAATTLELSGTDATSDGDAAGFSTAQNVELEELTQRRLEDNITRLLLPRYGKGGVVASAKVTLNYDKMITEENELKEKPEGGGGYTTHTEGDYTLNKEEAIAGIVGEENNTDAPGYGYSDGATKDGLTKYGWSTDYQYSYIKTQIEKGNAKVDRVTISVMVNEPNLSAAMKTELINLISTGADIPVGQINVSTFTAPQVVPEEPKVEEVLAPGDIRGILASIPWYLFLAIGAGAVIIIGTIVIIIFKRKNEKLRLIEENERKEAEALQRVHSEINEYKKQLSSAAKGTTSDVDEAIMTEVKDFAKLNPEVTASLLRSWLKE